VSPARPPSAGPRAGIRNAALRAAPAEQTAVPSVLHQGTGPAAVPAARDDLTQAVRSSGRPTRITVDLIADLHGFLRGYAQARDVAAADVMRELIRQLRADPDLSARVTAELERRREALAEAMRAARE
jgi:hypothetical protein